MISIKTHYILLFLQSSNTKFSNFIDKNLTDKRSSDEIFIINTIQIVMSVKIENQIVKEEVNDVKQYLSFSCILIK